MSKKDLVIVFFLNSWKVFETKHCKNRALNYNYWDQVYNLPPHATIWLSPPQSAQQAIEPIKLKHSTCTRIFKPVIITLVHYLHPIAFWVGDCELDLIAEAPNENAKRGINVHPGDQLKSWTKKCIWVSVYWNLDAPLGSTFQLDWARLDGSWKCANGKTLILNLLGRW